MLTFWITITLHVLTFCLQLSFKIIKRFHRSLHTFANIHNGYFLMICANGYIFYKIEFQKLNSMSVFDFVTVGFF